MGDRTSSQFYIELKKLAAPSISDDLVLTLWKNRLPVNVQRILTTIMETCSNDLTTVADRIHEISPEQPGQRGIEPPPATKSADE